MRSVKAQTARRHLTIYLFAKKEEDKTISEGRRLSEGLSIIEQDAPVSLGWWLLFFFLFLLLSLIRLYKYRCDYHHHHHHHKKKKKKNLFRCHYHSQSLIIHGVTPTDGGDFSLSKFNGAKKPEVSDQFRPIPSFTPKKKKKTLLHPHDGRIMAVLLIM